MLHSTRLSFLRAFIAAALVAAAVLVPSKSRASLEPVENKPGALAEYNAMLVDAREKQLAVGIERSEQRETYRLSILASQQEYADRIIQEADLESKRATAEAVSAQNTASIFFLITVLAAIAAGATWFLRQQRGLDKRTSREESAAAQWEWRPLAPFTPVAAVASSGSSDSVACGIGSINRGR